MPSYEAKRCQHIKVNGTQCGSPALRNEQLCYFHSQCRPVRVKSQGFMKDGELLLPAFEDATSIQFTLRQVMQLILEKKMDEDTAGVLLYALQIASSNLKRMSEEKPRPTQVVVDPETVAETPIGQTPWSASGDGHEVEDEGEEREQRLLREANEHWEGRYRQWKQWLEKGVSDLGRLLNEQPEPPAERLQSVLERVRTTFKEWEKIVESQLPPETIQACAEARQYVV